MFITNTDNDNGVHGQGLIFTIDMDSGEVQRTLKMVGPPGLGILTRELSWEW